MTLFLLDTSAVLAHAFSEPGQEELIDLLGGGEALIAAPSIPEFAARLRALGNSRDRVETAWRAYRAMFAEVVAIDENVARLAWTLREEAQERIPLVDALIASAALVRGATLVHRDPHFESLPEGRPARRWLARDPARNSMD